MARDKKAKLGEHLVTCDRSGRVIYASDARREWNGLLVHKDYWEPRHPQEFVRGVRDRQAVSDARPNTAADVTALATTTVSATTSARVIEFATQDLGSKKNVSRVDVVITDAGFSEYNRFVRAQISDDNVTFTDSGADPQPLAGVQSGETGVIQLGNPARYVKVLASSVYPIVSDYSATITVYGGDRNLTTTGDL
jgi:hypothetical protein